MDLRILAIFNRKYEIKILIFRKLRPAKTDNNLVLLIRILIVKSFIVIDLLVGLYREPSLKKRIEGKVSIRTYLIGLLAFNSLVKIMTHFKFSMENPVILK